MSALKISFKCDQEQVCDHTQEDCDKCYEFLYILSRIEDRNMLVEMEL